MYAASAGDAQIVKWFLREGANPNLRCGRGSSSLHRAIASNHLEIARILLDYPGIDVNLVDNSHHGATPLMLAISYSSSSILPLLLRKPGLAINEQSSALEKTALMQAASYGDESAVRLLLSHPGIEINLKNRWGTALTIAAKTGHVAVVETLLDHGANPDIREDTGPGGGTALNRAIDDGYIYVVRVLLERGADAKGLDTYNRTIVHSAAVNGQDDILRIIFERRAGVDINAQGTNGRTALHDAAYFNFCSTIQILFESGGRTDIRDEGGQSPLGLAKECNNTEAIALLAKLRKEEIARDESIGRLKHTTTSIDSTDMGLLRAVKLGMVDLVQDYIQKSRTDPSIDINTVDPVDHHSALHLCIKTKNTPILHLLASTPTINLNILDRRNRTPLHWSMLYYSHTAASILLTAGADTSPKDIFQYSALDIAIGTSDPLAALLLEHGAVPEPTQLQTALIIAAEYGSAESVRKLVGMGADPLKKNANGWSAFHYAEFAKNVGAARVVLELCEELERAG